ncbi:MAG: SDR family oxidoreductase [Pseudomonadota bacterium]
MVKEKSVVIVTGGTRGIGRACVERLHKDGFNVLFTHSNSENDAQALQNTLNTTKKNQVKGFQCNVTDLDAASRIFCEAEKLGEVVGLVNNAGITGKLGPITMLTDADLSNVVEVNLTSTIRLCREAAVRWSNNSNGIRRSIVNISSVAARTGSPGEYVAYAATKAAVETLSIGLAKELASVGVLVNAVSPGTIDTTIHARAGEPGRAMRVASRIPLGRPGQPEEIANALAWMLSDESSYVTGSVMNVAGGL